MDNLRLFLLISEMCCGYTLCNYNICLYGDFEKIISELSPKYSSFKKFTCFLTVFFSTEIGYTGALHLIFSIYKIRVRYRTEKILTNVFCGGRISKNHIVN